MRDRRLKTWPTREAAQAQADEFQARHNRGKRRNLAWVFRATHCKRPMDRFAVARDACDVRCRVHRTLLCEDNRFRARPYID